MSFVASLSLHGTAPRRNQDPPPTGFRGRVVGGRVGFVPSRSHRPVCCPHAIPTPLSHGIKDSVPDLVGHTPLLRVPDALLGRSCRALVLAKLEGMGFGKSVKDRIALSMIERAEKAGLIGK